jgi:cell wall-associated NlpC family hydrolase
MTKDEYKQILIRYLNVPYRWGGDDPLEGFDCSGLVQELLAILGIDPKGDQSANDLFIYFLKNGVKTDFLNLDTGFLLFYGADSRISHVALCYDSETIIEAGGGDQQTLSFLQAAKQNAYVRLRPVFHRKDLIQAIRPVGLAWN